MTKTYRPYQPEQDFLLPPSLRDWLPENHLTYFVSDLVEQLDLSAIYAVYEKDLRGQPPYDPRMMTKLLVYGYCVGVFSARKIEQRVVEDVGFRVLAAGNAPDFRTMADFRKIHRKALEGFFEQVLRVALEGGAVQVGRVERRKRIGFSGLLSAQQLAARLIHDLPLALAADRRSDSTSPVNQVLRLRQRQPLVPHEAKDSPQAITIAGRVVPVTVLCDSVDYTSFLKGPCFLFRQPALTRNLF